MFVGRTSLEAALVVALTIALDSTGKSNGGACKEAEYPQPELMMKSGLT